MKLNKRGLNPPLVIGGLILLLLIIVMLFPALFTSINPYAGDSLKSAVTQGGVFRISGAPFPPSKEFLLGSDLIGRDLYTLIIYGTRLTLTLGFLVVVGRFLLAIPMGIAAGFGNTLCRGLLNQFSILFSAIPALIISFIILSMSFFTSLYKTESILAFVIVLSFIGFGKLGQVVEERVEGILAKDFINGEKAIGKGTLQIAVQNVLPHLAPELVVLFFMEFAYALALIMQLGIFNVFVGNLRIIEDSGAGGVKIAPVSFEPEWASMLGAANTNLMSSPWTLLSPAVAFFISILGLNLFGEGLRKVLQKRDSGFVPKIRRMFTFERKDFRLSNLHPIKGRFRVVTVLVALFAIYVGIGLAAGTTYELDSKSYELPSAFVLPEVVIGTPEAEKMAGFIASELKRLGLKPVDESGYLLPYQNGSRYYCADASLELLNHAQKEKNAKLIFGTDFSSGSFGNRMATAPLYDTSTIDLFSVVDYHQFDHKLLLIDGNLYSASAIRQLSDKLMRASSAVGILVKQKKGQQLPTSYGENTVDYPFLWLTDSAAQVLAKAPVNTQISIKTSGKSLTATGNNVIGVLKRKGGEAVDSEKAILIGFSYNYAAYSSKEGLARLKLDLTFMKKLASMENKRSILVAFWDGMDSGLGNGAVSFSLNLPRTVEAENIDAYLDLTKLEPSQADRLQFSSVLAPISRYFAWSFAHKLKMLLEDQIDVVDYAGIRTVAEVQDSSPNQDEVMYFNGKMPVLYLASDNARSSTETKHNKSISADKVMSILLKAIGSIQY